MARPTNWPASMTDISNRVMVLVGEIKQFANIDTDATDNGRFIRTALYDATRTAQASFPWPELATLATLAIPDATFDNAAGSYPYSRRYALPDDYLRPINEDLYDYRVIGPYVYADLSADLPFHYQRYDEAVALWSGALCDCVVYRTALASCLAITQSEEQYRRIMAEYEGRVEPEAYRVASVSRENPNQIQRGSGVYARTRWGGGVY